MSNADDHRWDLSERKDGNLPESDDAFERKFEEWSARDWPDWLARNLAFPFTVTREEDEDDAYFASGAAKAPFRLGHKMEVLELAEEDVDQGLMVKVREKGQIGYVPLADLQVKPKTNPNFWPVREYVVWFANRYLRMKASFVGRWRIVGMELWDQDFIDLDGPGHITFAHNGRGEMHFGAVNLTLDWRLNARAN